MKQKSLKMWKLMQFLATVKPFSFFIRLPQAQTIVFQQSKETLGLGRKEQKFYLSFKFTTKESSQLIYHEPGLIAHPYLFLFISSAPNFKNYQIFYFENFYASFAQGQFTVKSFDYFKELFAYKEALDDDFYAPKEIKALKKKYQKLLNYYQDRELIGLSADEVLESYYAKANYELHAFCKFNKLTYKIED